MITVHHLGVSQSERIVWLCEELELPYRLERYDRDPTTRLAPAAYRALHPLGTAPIITDGDVVLPESGAIIEYIIAKYGAGRLAIQPDSPDFAAYVFWLHFANGSMMPNEMIGLIANRLGGGENDAVLQSLKSRSERAYAFIEQRLGEAAYFAGRDFTAADIIMFFPLTTMRAFVPREIAAFPNLCAYLKRVGQRSAYQRAMQKGDPKLPPLLN
ncbi:MAG: glutathione S-transferase family protein [Nevskia sp.]|nr:glutathione S-transferase family protein [Nevskia sp.]